MFNNKMIEIQKMEISLETQLEAFVFVLKLSYGCLVNEYDWLQKSITDIIESLIIAHRFLFCNQIKKLLSKQYFKKLQLLELESSHQNYSKSVSDNLSLICETYRLANFYDFEYLINECHDYFDKHATDSLLYFEKHLNYPIVLLEKILNRKSFGVEEMSIFYLVKKMIRKNGLKVAKPLIDVIRYPLLSLEQLSIITKSRVLKGVIGDSILKFMTTSEGSCSRVCFEIEKKFQTKDVSYQRARLSRSSLFHLLFDMYLYYDLIVSREDLNPIQLTIINLPIETLINHITIDIVKSPKYNFVRSLDFLYFFKIELFSSDGQKTIYKYFLIPILDLQDFYFEPKLVSHINIYCDNKILIESLSYEFTKNVVELKHLKNY
jgi:hypothetical protein